jgi:putative nucleotidyltransferase with HDIG domain
MSNGGRSRTRLERVSRIELPPTRLERVWSECKRPVVLVRLAMCLVAALAITGLTRAWEPPFWYRAEYVPAHPLLARVAFEVPDVNNPDNVKKFEPGDLLAAVNNPLQPEDVRILRYEHEAWLAHMTTAQRAARATASLGLVLALFGLCGFYVVYREPRVLRSRNRFASLLLLVVLTVGMTRWLSIDPYRAELVPMLLFGFTIAIAYSQELALVLSAAVALVLVMGSGHELDDFVILMGTNATAILLCGRIRSRNKLIKVGSVAAVSAFFLTVGVDVLNEQPLAKDLFVTAGRNALWTLATGFLITGLLPFIEKRFGVLTDISLLEMGDVSHPLLQELVRRSPGTHNHSINVASLAEAAADAIGANGLLVRVGAYFHDIGKMFKPGYFVENQQDVNHHEALVPAMSTLIIIAHVKDGADLARQHHLPEPIIDFIEQHHGTTLVEYFYHRANQQSEEHPEKGHVLESSYRYPGPKPQTKEAAVLMLADAVESASRVLVEPNPARLQDLVHEMGLKRLHDGQFDECGLNLQELRTIEDSLVKSLTAVYHGRVKYPSSRTA